MAENFFFKRKIVDGMEQVLRCSILSLPNVAAVFAGLEASKLRLNNARQIREVVAMVWNAYKPAYAV